ncbi:MAG: DNA repair protein RecN [Candidatus Hydrogenedentes bacterium]|nr:DNA repair protein RecN [Candidatus Hydrogenedentota bacterium]
MLATLRIQNFALIDTVEIDFQQGFNALTGETGAGKSILIGALNLVLGARASGDVLRAGADKVQIDALFQLPAPGKRLLRLLKEHDIEWESDELHLSRTVSKEGRTRGYINGTLVPIAVLSSVGDELVDVHGQHDHQSLLKQERQLELLDAFGGTEDAVFAMRKQVTTYREVERQIADMEDNDRNRNRQMEFLRFEAKEIDAAGLSPGEDAELKARINRITNAESVLQTAQAIYARLYEVEEVSVIDQLTRVARDLDELAALDDRFVLLATQLTDAQAAIDAIAAEIRGYTEGLSFDPQELDELNQRNSLLGDLKRKYGNSVEEILAYREKIAAELDGYENRDEHLAVLKAQAETQLAALTASGKKLTKKRKKAANALEKKVTESLQDLGMKGAQFAAGLESSPLSATGFDRAAFQLAANQGEALKPLRSVASGGEISRIMLAIKTVLAGVDTIPTLIFDEIDAGIGGDVARMVARKMKAVAESHQVLSVTHLAQIAAVASVHLAVTKTTDNGRTRTDVIALSGATREKEIARLLDGSVSKVSLEHAQALLGGEG